MAGTLNITNIVQAITASGQPLGMFQGPIGGVSSTPLNIANLSLTNVFGSPSFTGNGFFKSGMLASGSAPVKVFDSSADTPSTWNYFMVWADQPLYIQLITSAVNAEFQILPTVPFILSVNGLLAAVSTTPISTMPTLVAIAKIYLSNFTGITANWQVLAYL